MTIFIFWPVLFSTYLTLYTQNILYEELTVTFCAMSSKVITWVSAVKRTYGENLLITVRLMVSWEPLCLTAAHLPSVAVVLKVLHRKYKSTDPKTSFFFFRPTKLGECHSFINSMPIKMYRCRGEPDGEMKQKQWQTVLNVHQWNKIS